MCQKKCPPRKTSKQVINIEYIEDIWKQNKLYTNKSDLVKTDINYISKLTDKKNSQNSEITLYWL